MAGSLFAQVDQDTAPAVFPLDARPDRSFTVLGTISQTSFLPFSKSFLSEIREVTSGLRIQQSINEVNP